MAFAVDDDCKRGECLYYKLLGGVERDQRNAQAQQGSGRPGEMELYFAYITSATVQLAAASQMGQTNSGKPSLLANDQCFRDGVPFESAHV
jgi:hypothetical protein